MNLGIIAVATTVELMSRLVAVPSSTADIPKVNEAQEFMAGYLGGHGVACTVEAMPNGRKVLYASATGEKTPDLMLSVHLDVVPGNPGQYELKQEGDIVRGRGVRDCKGPCAAVANAMIALNGKASVGVIFGADEEKGGHSTRFMVEKGYRPRRMVLVVDGPDWNRIDYAQKGHAYFRVTAKGKGGHSSRPWLADDSIGTLCRAVARVEDEWAAKNPLPDDKWGDVLTVTWLGADGGAYNRIPDEASAVFDLRSVRADSADSVEAFLREATGLTVERISNSQPCSSDPKHPLSVALRETLRRHIPGEEIPFDRLNAATDARCFHDCGVPAMIVAIKGGDGHGSNEWADVPSIDRMQRILVDFALTNFRKKGEAQ